MTESSHAHLGIRLPTSSEANTRAGSSSLDRHPPGSQQLPTPLPTQAPPQIPAPAPIPGPTQFVAPHLAPVAPPGLPPVRAPAIQADQNPHLVEIARLRAEIANL